MKRSLKVILALAAVMLLGSNASFAQKFGYINSQDLLAAMPEKDSVSSKLDAYSKDLQSTLENIQVEFNNKLQDYQKSTDTLSPTLKQLKERELQDLQNRYEEFQQSAQQDMQRKQQELMGPLVDKAQAAIKKVSKAAGLTMVYDTSSGAMVYYDEAAMMDILPLVKKELGIANTPPATAAPAKK